MMLHYWKNLLRKKLSRFQLVEKEYHFWFNFVFKFDNRNLLTLNEPEADFHSANFLNSSRERRK